MKKLYCMVIIIMVSQAVFTEEPIKGYSVSPFLNYSYLQFDEQQIHSPGLGVIVTKGNLTHPLSSETVILSAPFWDGNFKFVSALTVINVWRRMTQLVDSPKSLGLCQGQPEVFLTLIDNKKTKMIYSAKPCGW